jgi:hypothetical protein
VHHSIDLSESKATSCARTSSGGDGGVQRQQQWRWQQQKHYHYDYYYGLFLGKEVIHIHSKFFSVCK